MNAVLHSSDRMDWETPQEFFDELDREFGFTLDVAASHETAKCEKYFTPANNGLEQPWAPHTCWLNPPYGRQIKHWIRKAYEESQLGATVVCLIPARTDTSYWHEFVMRGEIRFIRGRLKFLQDGKVLAPAPFPSAVVVFRP